MEPFRAATCWPKTCLKPRRVRELLHDLIWLFAESWSGSGPSNSQSQTGVRGVVGNDGARPGLALPCLASPAARGFPHANLSTSEETHAHTLTRALNPRDSQGFAGGAGMHARLRKGASPEGSRGGGGIGRNGNVNASKQKTK